MTRRRVALFGGDGRNAAKFADRGEVTVYQSLNEGKGDGEKRRLIASIKAGSFSLVIILAKWIGHEANREVRKVCRIHNIPLEVIR